MSLIDETKRGNGAQVTALLAARIADPNVADVKGCTALHHAVDKGKRPELNDELNAELNDELNDA